ncbi:MAG: hypothetical protein AAAFM81_10940, partial [Pseudomonadota bacterium]
MQARSHKIATAVALALGVIGGDALALELGEIKVRSALGERLVAELPVASDSPVGSDCFTATSDALDFSRNGISIRFNGRSIVIRSSRVITDPIIDLKVTARCSSASSLQRDYTLFINPSNRVSEQQRAALIFAPEPQRNRVATTNRRVDRSARQPAPRVSQTRPAITPGSEYRVQSGDSISAI